MAASMNQDRQADRSPAAAEPAPGAEPGESGPRVLITGGAGFLARALLAELLRPDALLQPRWIRLLDHRPSPHHADPRVERVVADIRTPAALRQCCQEVDLVFHCAALVDWGQHPAAVVRAVNVDGTTNVVEACREAGVRALVHVSTLDVVYGGKPVHEADEHTPLPQRHASVYCQTKAEAEGVALGASGAARTPRHPADTAPLRVVALRPSCIFGEADPYHVSSFLRMSRRTPLPRLGNGQARHQHVYVGNMAHAMVLAGRALLEGADGVDGEAFFVTDFPARNTFDYLAPILEALGQRLLPWRFGLPFPLMYGLGSAMEAVAALLRPVHRFTPSLSRFSVRFVCQDFTVSGEKAQRVLGYSPRYSEAAAFERTIAYFREHGPVPPRIATSA